MFAKKAVLLLTAVLAAYSSGCATYQDQVRESRKLISSGNAEQSLGKFQELAAKEDGDQLVHLLDYGVALQIANKYPESNEVLLRSDKLADELDYHSVSRLAGSMLTSEEVVQYKGDTFEKIFKTCRPCLFRKRVADFDCFFRKGLTDQEKTDGFF